MENDIEIIQKYTEILQNDRMQNAMLQNGT
jgi:hypothetical protein